MLIRRKAMHSGVSTLLTVLGLTLFHAPPAQAQLNENSATITGFYIFGTDDYGATDSPEDVIIRVKAGCTILDVLSDCDASVHDSLPAYRTSTMHPAASSNHESLMKQLQASLHVTHVEPNRAVRLPGGVSMQHALDFDGSHGFGSGVYQNHTVARQINLGSLGNLTSGAGVVVAVLDTGVDMHHPDLQANLMCGYNFINPDASPDDALDGTEGNPAYGHGTMVAGVIHSIAPDATIMPLRVLNGDGVGSLSDMLAGIAYAVQAGADIINISSGMAEYSQFLEEAIEDAEAHGVLVVASAGNSGTSAPHYPAAFAGVQSVTSVEENYAKSSFADYGAWVQFVAPGDGIVSDYPAPMLSAVGTGTSFAAPFVSGAAALMLSINTNPDVSIIDVLRYSAHSVDLYNPSVFSGQLGYGMIDISTGISWLPP